MAELPKSPTPDKELLKVITDTLQECRDMSADEEVTAGFLTPRVQQHVAPLVEAQKTLRSIVNDVSEMAEGEESFGPFDVDDSAEGFFDGTHIVKWPNLALLVKQAAGIGRG